MGMVLQAEKEMEEAFEVSTLPESPDQEKLEDILVKIRYDFYNT